MSDGNTLIGNALVGHGLEQEETTQGETLLATEEGALEHAEEQIMQEGGGTSEDEEKMERQMLTVALVTSVVETAKQNPTLEKDKGPATSDASRRSSLRKRRRPSGEKPLEDPGAKDVKLRRVQPNIQNAQVATKPPDSQKPTRAAASAPNPTHNVAPKPSVAPIEALKPKAKIRTEAVPACTVTVAAAPLSVPLAAPSSLPTASSLPPALQPPVRSILPSMPTALSAPIATRAVAPQRPPKEKAQQLVPAARVMSSGEPLIPNPAATGVPNPLCLSLPSSKSRILPSQPLKTAPGPAPVPSNTTFIAGAKLAVPCPLPPSTFQNNSGQARQLEARPAPQGVTQQVQEKKKVTIDLPMPRGRIFSIDLDPASLDFSVLDTGDSGAPAPASADLPLVTGAGRDRAFSFECFAFGINADEPLPPVAEQASVEASSVPARQRGDSIIFDPASFQEGGIHEERALTTRQSRAMSVDLVAAGLISPSLDGPELKHPGNLNFTSEHPPPPPVSSSSATTALPAVVQSTPGNPSQVRTAHVNIPDTAQSNVGADPLPPPPPQHYAAPPTHPPQQSHVYQHHNHPGQPTAAPVVSSGPHPVVSSSNPPPPLPPQQDIVAGRPSSTVSIVASSCSSSTTLQMELLNKGGRIGIYLPEARRERIARFHAKRKMRIWRKRIKYDCRKKLADSRPRIKGRFVKRAED